MKALLFDMDGVLVDVSYSYRTAVEKTVGFYSGRKIGPGLIQAFKDRGGFNNDWDLSQAILADFSIHPTRGEIVDTFQKFYLGQGFQGLIQNERWLIRTEVLGTLLERFILGIVTGRPQAEALYTLNRFGVSSFFRTCVCLEDVGPDKGKPDPEGIFLALANLDAETGAYAGDTLDDMEAAVRAGLQAVGVVPDLKEDAQADILRRNGACTVIEDINLIGEVIR